MPHNEDFPSPEATMALLKGRRSIRQYTSDPVPDELLEQVLEAGRWAPSATDRQPWHFIVIREPEIRAAVAEHAAYYFIRWAHVEEAPVIIALCGDRKNRVYRQFLHEDIGLAGGQMMLRQRRWAWAPAGSAGWIATRWATSSSSRSTSSWWGCSRWASPPKIPSRPDGSRSSRSCITARTAIKSRAPRRRARCRPGR